MSSAASGAAGTSDVPRRNPEVLCSQLSPAGLLLVDGSNGLAVLLELPVAGGGSGGTIRRKWIPGRKCDALVEV